MTNKLFPLHNTIANCIKWMKKKEINTIRKHWKSVCFVFNYICNRRQNCGAKLTCAIHPCRHLVYFQYEQKDIDFKVADIFHLIFISLYWRHQKLNAFRSCKYIKHFASSSNHQDCVSNYDFGCFCCCYFFCMWLRKQTVVWC